MSAATTHRPAGLFATLPLLVALAADAPRAARAQDFTIPGGVAFGDEPQRADGEVYLGDAIGRVRAGGESYFVVHVPDGSTSMARPGRGACALEGDLVRIRVAPFGDATGKINRPVLSADGPTAYADIRYFRGSSFNRDGFLVHRFRCDEAQALEPGLTAVVPTQVQLTYDPAFATAEPAGPLLAWEDRVCVASPRTVGCASLAEATPTLRPLTTALEVALHLAPAPSYEAPEAWRAAMASLDWSFETATALPDGRIAALLRYGTPSDLPGRLGVASRYLVVLGLDGGLERVLYATAARWHTDRTERTGLALTAVRGLAYHPERHAVVAWPVDDYDWTLQRAIESDGAGNSQVRKGFSGTGLLLLPLDQPGVGYLPLSAAIVDSDYTRDGGAGGGLALLNSVPSLTSFALLGSSRAVVGLSRPTREPLLRWEDDRVDLDQDGLDATEEARLGTSDWRWDSDADGLADGVEAASGLDPRRDDGVLGDRAFGRGQITLAQSAWLKTWRLPELAAGLVVSNPGTEGPLCVGWRCTWPDGHALRVPHAIASISLDGLVAVSPDGALRTDLVTGETTPWLPTPLREQPGYAWYVESAESAFYFDPVARALLHIDATAVPRVVFAVADHLDPRPGSDYPLSHRGPTQVHPFGYHQETGRVLLGAMGGWDAWTLAVGADGVAHILERAQGLARVLQHAVTVSPGASFPGEFPFPDRLQPNGHGDYISDRFVHGPYLENGRAGGYLGYLGAEDLSRQRLTGGWGDVLVDAGTGEELVTVFHEVERGDVLVASEGMLYRIGPRGGVAPLWPEPRIDVPMERFALSAAGRACFVAYTPTGRWSAGSFMEFSPAEDGRIPDVRTAAIDGYRFLDCAYDDEDTIRFLIDVTGADGNPRAQIMRWRRGEVALEAVGEPVNANNYRGFFDHPRSGARYEPFDYQSVEPDAIELWLDDGRRVRKPLVVRASDPFGARLLAHLGVATAAILDGAARPDGIVILRTSAGLVAWHADLDTFARVVTFGGDLSGAVARVPGGVARDPWTGQPTAGVLLAGGAAAEGLSPLGPEPLPPSGGAPVGPQGGDGDGGCAGAPASQALLAGALGLIAVAIARRRRVGSAAR